VLYPVTVKLVTLKYLNQIVPRERGETVLGGYVTAENTIYIAKEQDAKALMHTLWHELKHAFDDQVKMLLSNSEPLDAEEAMADAFASMIMRVIGERTPQEVLRAKK